MTSDSRPAQLVPELPPEEQARANLYALIARLFYAPPDRDLLDRLAAEGELPGEDAKSALALAWRDLAQAAAGAEPDAVREEYETHFIGTGKAAISLYTTAYTAKTAVDNPLVDIREFMAQRGLERRIDAFEPEDHIAALSEIMRHLVAEQHATIEEQERFFLAFISVGGRALCDAIGKHPNTAFYKHVARLAHSFFELEQITMDMN